MAVEIEKQTLSSSLKKAFAENFTGSLSFDSDESRIYLLLGKPTHIAIKGVSPPPVELEALKILAKRHPADVVVHHHRQDPTPGSNLAGINGDDILRLFVDTLASSSENPPPVSKDVRHTDTRPLPVKINAPNIALKTEFTTSGQPLVSLPLLPSGTALFEKLALGALNLDILVTTFDTGLVIVENLQKTGIILVKSFKPFQTLFFDGNKLFWDKEALNKMQVLPDAFVSVYHLPEELLSILPQIVKTPIVYDALQLEWINWPSLLKELERREGLGVVELETPGGKGVLLLNMDDDKQSLAYTDLHKVPGPRELLNPLLSTGKGTIRVRHTGKPVPLPEDKKEISQPQKKQAALPDVVSPQVETGSQAASEEETDSKTTSDQEALSIPNDAQFEIEEAPQKDNAFWDGVLKGETSGPTRGSEDFPLEELQSTAKTIIGPTANRLEPIFSQAKENHWTGDKLYEEIQKSILRAVSPEKKESLAQSLKEILDENS